MPLTARTSNNIVMDLWKAMEPLEGDLMTCDMSCVSL
jgi:hypothetical protein